MTDEVCAALEEKHFVYIACWSMKIVVAYPV